MVRQPWAHTLGIREDHGKVQGGEYLSIDIATSANLAATHAEIREEAGAEGESQNRGQHRRTRLGPIHAQDLVPSPLGEHGWRTPTTWPACLSERAGEVLHTIFSSLDTFVYLLSIQGSFRPAKTLGRVPLAKTLVPLLNLHLQPHTSETPATQTPWRSHSIRIGWTTGTAADPSGDVGTETPDGTRMRAEGACASMSSTATFRIAMNAPTYSHRVIGD